MIRFICALLLIMGVALSVCAQEKNATADFIRYNEGDGLQIAVTDYVSSGTTVTLYGVVHIADADYYKKVQKDLDGYDAVLYEGVGGDKMKQPKDKQPASLLSIIQHLAGDVLDLQFQLDSIDYTRKNLVHADISSMEDLKEKMNGESITPLGNYVKDDQLSFLKPIADAIGPFVKSFLKSQPEVQNDLKRKLAHQLSEADVNAQLSPEMHKAIVLDRNQIVIDVLNDQLKNHADHKRISVFYGAAHMPDLEKRLAKMGFKKSEKRWMTAWAIKESAEEEPGDDEAKPRQGRMDDRKRKIEDEGK